MIKRITSITKILAIGLFAVISSVQAQSVTVNELIDEVDYDNLKYMLEEFTGERKTTVGGKTVTIKTRKEDNNDLAKDYIVEKIKSFSGDLDIQIQKFNRVGKNIIVTQEGKENPDNIHIISAHYDSVTDYCADDNATGTTGVLEIAKTLSQVCLDDTIVYIFWDEEEIGLLGSDYYAKNLSKDMIAKLKTVINIDMLGYDYKKDRNIPVHSKNVANSNQLKDDVLKIIEKYNDKINLTPEVPSKPVEGSDHASFWKQNITAIMVTDGLSYGTITPHYHKPTDKIATLEDDKGRLTYFHDMTKALMAIMAERCSISKDQSPCSFSVGEYTLSGVEVYPVPVKDFINIRLQNSPNNAFVKLINVEGKEIVKQNISKLETKLDTKNLASGIYFVKVTSGGESFLTKVIKE